MRIALAEDAALLRAGLVGLLERSGHVVVAEVTRADLLIPTIERLSDAVDLVITDVRMPPTMTDDGLRAALELRQRRPDLPILVLSQYVAAENAARLLADPTGAGTGYLLKERVGRVADFMNSLDDIARGGVVVDPEVVVQLLRQGRGDARLARLTARETEVLELMAQGLANQQIADRLVVTVAAVAKHVANVFAKLDLGADEGNRRVRAVLAWLQHRG